MALEDYLPFDPAGRETDTADDLDDLFDGLGLNAWEDVMTDVFDVSIIPDKIRGTLYSTPEEALFDIVARGIVFFTKIIYFPDINLYSLYVEY